jgi:hypothetical protein
LLVRFPERYRNLSPLGPGEKTDGLVSFVDFAPTVLNLVGLPIPDYMQGRAFLGKRPSAPREYIYGISSRVDEAYEFSRCVRGNRYKYIRNFMPHLPYIQPSEYPDRAEIMQELRRAVAEEALTKVQKQLWGPTKPVEELYDTVADPHEIENLAGSTEHQRILATLRTILRQWMLQTHDTGLLPEAEMHIRAEGSTPYEMAQDVRRYPQRRILDAADLVGKWPEYIPAMVEVLKDPDGAARYWAAVALGALGPDAAPAAEALKPILKDSCPNARFAAAGTLCKLDLCDEALGVLAQGLSDEREETVLYAARELQSIGDKACPLVQKMKDTQARYKAADGTYKNQNHAMFIDWALKNALANCGQ